MTDEQLAAWKQDAEETLAELDFDKHTKDNFVLYGASLAIMGRDILMALPVNAAVSPQESQAHTPEYYIEDELNAADEYYRMGFGDMARDELRHASFWIERMKHVVNTPQQQAMVRDYETRYAVMAQAIG